MPNDKRTYNAPSKAPRDKKPTAHTHPDEWLHEWHHIVFPLRNGTNLSNYKPKIEKYIKDWLDLVGDVTQNGKKYKLKDFEFRLVEGTLNEFEVHASAVEDVTFTTNHNVNKTKIPGGSGSPDEIPVPGHVIPHPPPPPPK